MSPPDALSGGAHHRSRVTGRRWLTRDTFVLDLEQPPDFRFIAGQRIQIRVGEEDRDYSLIPGDRPQTLTLLIRSVPGGSVSVHLGRSAPGVPLAFSGPSGHFIYRSASRTAVFIATGTGVAPFTAMCRSGVTGFTLLHGVRRAEDLYFRDMLEAAAGQYIPCLSGMADPLPARAFAGRVTACLEERLPRGDYDFYLAGRRDMIADVTAIVDARYPSARVYAEIFY